MRYYLGPMLWMGLMFLFSTDVGSMDNTNAFLAPLIKVFAPEISRKNLVMTLIAIRKLAHVVEYAVLSILWLYALKQGKPGCLQGVQVLALFRIQGVSMLEQEAVNAALSTLVNMSVCKEAEVTGLFPVLGLRCIPEKDPARRVQPLRFLVLNMCKHSIHQMN